MIVWLNMPLALAIHDRLLAEHGGSSGVRDAGLLESALARPQQLHAYGDPMPDLADLASSLAHGIAKNHPFVDGNKRTAYTCCETFMMLNGAEVEAEPGDKYVMVLMLAEGRCTPAEFASWLRRHVPPVEHRHSVQEPPTQYGKRAKTSAD